jgi:diguanylate cyclase (GGDEF)-like protein
LPAPTGGDQAEVTLDEQHLSARLPGHGRRGRGRLLFSDPFVETEFRRHFAKSSHPKVRPLLVVSALAVVLITGIGMVGHNISVVTATFLLAVMMPLLTAALIVSYQSERQILYQVLLSLSVLCIGLIVNSIALRASLHGMPYFFAAQVALMFLVWLVLGLLFPYAAITTTIISAVHVWGLFHWNINSSETQFAILMLMSVNLVAGLCCYQFESAARRSFADSKFLTELADHDGLTGLYNRRAFDAHMERVWRQSRRDQSPFTIIMIDIDHFKPYNDRYGHQCGDDALRRVANVIAMGAQRPLDCAARYGGEEFVLVLYGPAGRDLPEQIRRQVEELAIPHAGSTAGGHLTVSVGAAIVTPSPERSMQGTIQIADEALSQAKDEGRNRVVVKESKHTHVQTGRFRAVRQASA